MTTDYSKSKTHILPLAKNVFADFTAVCGGDEYALSHLLHSRFIVDDFAYHDDHVYFDVYEYFKQKVIPHKIAVYQAGLELLKRSTMHNYLSTADQEQFLRNLWVHDLSKFSANEAFGYAAYNFKNPTPVQKQSFEASWHHHKMNNPHHPEYWHNPNRSGVLEPIKMPTIYIVEMLADWIGAGRTYGSTLEAWLPDNLSKFQFGPNRSIVREIIEQLANIKSWIHEGGILKTYE